MAFYMLRNFLSYLFCWVFVLNMNEHWILSNSVSITIATIVWFLSFSLLMWYINLRMLNWPCIAGENSHLILVYNLPDVMWNFPGSFLITAQSPYLQLLVCSGFISSSCNLGRLYVSRNLSFSSRLSNMFTYNHSY